MAKQAKAALTEAAAIGYFINAELGYYEGDRIGDDIEVPQRPSGVHEWDGEEWLVNPIKKAETLKAALDILEREGTSLRAIREILIQVLLYFAGLQHVAPEALYAQNPAFKGLKDLDTQASEIRAQIRELT